MSGPTSLRVHAAYAAEAFAYAIEELDDEQLANITARVITALAKVVAVGD